MKIEQYHQIGNILCKYNIIFYKMWSMSYPIFDSEITQGRACVTFNKSGEFLNYYFDPDFFESLDLYQLAFVVAHETLHIILNHPKRLKKDQASNIAADVAIHEIMFNQQDWDYNKVADLNLCTINSIFKPLNIEVEENQSAEYYYDKLKQKALEQLSAQPLDSHEWGEGSISIELSEKEAKELNKLQQGNSENTEKESTESGKTKKSNGKQAGKNAGNNCIIVKTKIVMKSTWENAIDKWTRLSQDLIVKEQWVYDNRRLTGMSNQLMLPSEKFFENEKREKIHVTFFLDTSGSCAHLAKRFFKAANSLNPKRFTTDLYCFDTNVYPIVNGKLSGFGGTSFSCIEQYISKMAKYPQCIFVITDGYGDRFQTKYPERWHWFLSENYTAFIPKGSRIFNLKDFE